MLTPNQCKQVDELARREQEITDNLICPRCHGPRTDATRRFCAPCVLHHQAGRLKYGGAISGRYTAYKGQKIIRGEIR